MCPIRPAFCFPMLELSTSIRACVYPAVIHVLSRLHYLLSVIKPSVRQLHVIPINQQQYVGAGTCGQNVLHGCGFEDLVASSFILMTAARQMWIEVLLPVEQEKKKEEN